jgi:hypothetical protein
LRVWLKPDFATFKCARCDIAGYAAFADKSGSVTFAASQVPPDRDDDDRAARQLEKARWLWHHAVNPEGTPAETYLRARGITGPIPATLRVLPARPPRHMHPAMIAPFALASEPVPGVLHVAENDIYGVHLTLLHPDGNGKAEAEPNKYMVGPSNGWPIVLAPPSDGLALGIAEGIETALSMHMQTGVGVWAAGSAGRLPALADRVPGYIESVTVAVEDDPAGRRGAEALVQRLHARGIEARLAHA